MISILGNLSALNRFRNWFNLLKYLIILIVIRTDANGSYEGDLTIAAPVELDWRTLINQYKYPLALFVMMSEDHVPSNDPSTIVNFQRFFSKLI